MKALYLSGRVTAIARSTAAISSAVTVRPSMRLDPLPGLFCGRLPAEGFRERLELRQFHARIVRFRDLSKPGVRGRDCGHG